MSNLPIVGQFLGGDKGPADSGSAAADIAEKPKKEAAEERAGDFATREQVLNRQAAEAGATRSGNDADLLGVVRPKKRTASRAILG